MKRVKFLLALLTVGLIMTSCSTTQRVYDEGYDDNGTTRTVGNRIYVDDPYYGNVILERDPISGRYYDVTYGYRGYGAAYNGWSNFRRGYSTYYRNYPSHNQYPKVQANPRPVRPAPQPMPQSRTEARRRILGN